MNRLSEHRGKHPENGLLWSGPIELSRKSILCTLTMLCGLIFAGSEAALARDKPLAACKEWLLPLGKELKEVASRDGIWAGFEKHPPLGPHSPKGLKLDSRMNELFFDLNYLCDTREGVPLNEIAVFVSKNVKRLGAERFKEEQIEKLGKTRAEVETWLKYSEYAKTLEKRTLAPKKIRASVGKAENLFHRYLRLSDRLQTGDHIDEALAETEALLKDIDHLLRADPYLALSVEENARAPFWDIDENYGGS